MHTKSAKKVSESSVFQVIVILFTLLAVLYLPADTAGLRSAELPSYDSPAIDCKIAFPKSFKAEINVAVTKVINRYRETQALQQNANRTISQEQQINKYISEVVSERYPELDCKTIQAIVYNESHYISEAINNSSGTMGLMQISPKWHKERAISLGVTDLLDAYGNILVGCDILAEVTRESGSFDYALDVFAGGYSYANSYIGSISPTREHIYETVSLIDSGVISF